MRRRMAVAGGAVAAVLAAGALTAASLAGGEDDDTKPARLPKATATVERGDLVDTETVDGTLGYGDEVKLTAGASGKITWLPAEGATVRRGHTLYDLNGKPVTLMYGAEPVYRPLYAGVADGRDVRQLERNLKALGYGGFTVDDHFTADTADAVERWQDDRDLPETGQIDGAQIAFAPGAVRVTALPVPVGGRLGDGQPVLMTTGTDRLVRIDLDAADQSMARKGAKVSVELPGNKTVPGRISAVGTVATAPASANGQTSDTKATIEVNVVLDRPKDAGRLDQAPVSVELESERHRDVLSVPLEALVARREGGYAVQVVSGGTVRLVPVETGLYGDTRVEVRGAGLVAGTKVGVPAR
ncbi:efflux RND transporter periplasmic adaptor subunit [Actinomadura rayongensis]|uniref:HlyD family efflux transporter periplasmic adaptor subunit n=1 Tax=Actinomadura rayongensis TaxID=1429076 RepID=A0A6I4W3A0_9ACTN|nr:peptidoglycan-binding protein [Actinomadura rayongensis]MXQ64657.1 HlyD family efflux transporter periplasmic adaptor subunit [Actinomadura rayongensis]